MLGRKFAKIGGQVVNGPKSKFRSPPPLMCQHATSSHKKRRRMDGGAFGEISLHSGSFVTAPAFDPSMMPSGSTSVSAVNSLSARAY